MSSVWSRTVIVGLVVGLSVSFGWSAGKPFDKAQIPARKRSLAEQRAEFRKKLVKAQQALKKPTVDQIASILHLKPGALSVAGSLSVPTRVSVIQPKNKGITMTWKAPTEIITDSGPDGAVWFDGSDEAAQKGWVQIEMPVQAGHRYAFSFDTYSERAKPSIGSLVPFPYEVVQVKNGLTVATLAEGGAESGVTYLSVGAGYDAPTKGSVWIRFSYDLWNHSGVDLSDNQNTWRVYSRWGLFGVTIHEFTK